MTLIDVVAYRLADEVIGNGMTGQPVFLKKRPFGLYIAIFFQGLLDVKMIAPAGQFNPVVAHVGHQREEFFEG